MLRRGIELSAGIDIPKIVVSLDEVVPPQEDVVDCRVHLGASREVSSFEFAAAELG